MQPPSEIAGPQLVAWGAVPSTRESGCRHWTLEGEIDGDDFAWFSVEQVDGAFFLYRHDATGAVLADTWHLTLEEATQQAALEGVPLLRP